jgi:hypothetical protein
VAAKRKTKPCLYCGEPFEPIRSTAKFCSDRCRVAANRAGLSGLDEATVYALEYADDIPEQFERWKHEVAIPKLDAEMRAIREKDRVPHTLFDADAAREAATNRYVKACEKWLPEAIRRRSPSRR